MKLSIGDTIECHDQEDMLEAHKALMDEGIFTDWLNIREPYPKKYTLTITGFDEECEYASVCEKK